MNKETKNILNLLEKEDEKNMGKTDEKSELEALRFEKAMKENLARELEILLSIFPDINVEDIPDSVFEETDNGKGLAGAYLLYKTLEDKKAMEEKKKDEENSASAPPEINEAKEEPYFTPEAVEKMSRQEIRKNYKNIIKSMEKWK